jgi:hypothetical protein
MDGESRGKAREAKQGERIGKSMKGNTRRMEKQGTASGKTTQSKALGVERHIERQKKAKQIKKKWNTKKSKAK